ncbi:MAG: hypothetical protein AB7V06_25590 [Candidatus Obscuribacterales bacterium]
MAKKPTKYLKFRGKSSYAMIYKPDEYKGSEFWRLNLHPDAETIEKIKSAGIQTKLQPSNEEYSNVPGKFFKFRRDCEKTFGSEVRKFMPPRVLDKSGKALVDYKEVPGGYEMIGEKVLIGNGSEVEVTLEVFDAGRFGVGARLHEVKIIDLIEYIKPEEVDPDEDAPFEEKAVENKVETTPSKKTTVAW